jgi:hypothetical protein
MARVPITVMGFRCERCSHEWIPRGPGDEEPRVCPTCRSPWWNTPRTVKSTYEDFRAKIADVLGKAADPLTWTEVRTTAGLPQLFPNNQWVHRLERDIGLRREKDANGIIHWRLGGVEGTASNEPTAKTPDQARPRARRKQGAVE